MSFSQFGHNAEDLNQPQPRLVSNYFEYQKGGSDHEAAIRKFFKDHPNPSDQEVHRFASQLGINKHRFEEMIYALLSKLLRT